MCEMQPAYCKGHATRGMQQMAMNQMNRHSWSLITLGEAVNDVSFSISRHLVLLVGHPCGSLSLLALARV